MRLSRGRCRLPLFGVLTAVRLSVWQPQLLAAQDRTQTEHSVPIVPLSTVEPIVLALQDVWNFQDPVRTTIRDQEHWEKFWDQAFGHASSAPARPSVDFSREMLVLASNGQRQNYDEVAITSVVMSNDSLVVHVRSRANVPPGCNYDAVFSPMAIVRIPKDGRPTRFVEERIDELCGHPTLRPPPSKP